MTETSSLSNNRPVSPRAGVAVAAAMLVANIANYGFQVLTGRALSVQEYGLLSGLMSALTIVTVSTAALQTAAARSIAAGEADPHDTRRIDHLTRTSIVVAVVAGALIAAAVPVITCFLNIGYLPILFLAAYVTPAALDSVAAGRLQGSRRFRSLAIYSTGQAVAKFLMTALVLLLGAKVSGIVAGLVLSSTAIAVLGLLASRDVGALHSHALSPDARRGFVAFALFWIILSADVAFARAFFEPDAAGRYAAASVLGKAVLWLPTIITNLVFPSLVNRSERGKAAGRVMGQAIMLVVGITSTACLGLYALGEPAFKLLYGSRYTGAADIAWKVGLAMIPLAIVNLLLFHFLARGQNRFLWWIAVACAAELAALYLGPKTATSYALVLGAIGIVLLLALIPNGAWKRLPEVVRRHPQQATGSS